MNRQSTIKTLFIFAISSFFFCSTYSQENYLPGYIISQEGDSVKGFINYLNWNKNPKRISFRATKEGTKVNYFPYEIKRFGVSDEIYVRAVVETEVSPFKLGSLDDSPLPNIKTDTVFLQMMIAGPKSLFYHKSSKSRENFFVEENGIIQLLVQKKYYKHEPGGKGVAENRKFAGQVTYYLQDCPEIQSKVSRIKYTKSSLEKIFQQYYNCTNTKVSFQKTSEKLKIEAGALGGMSITNLSFSSDLIINSLPLLTRSNYPASFNPSGGLFLDIIFPRKLRALSLTTEVIYNEYKVSSTEGLPYAQIYWQTNYSAFDFSYIKLNNLFRYRYPVGSWNIYANVGISNGFALRQMTLVRNEIIRGSNITTSEKSAFSRLRGYEQSLLGGIGVQYKAFSFETRYEIGNGFSWVSGLSVRARRTYFLLGYKF